MAIDLDGRVCIITGAATGIGRAIAEGFVERGAIVFATDIEAPDIPRCAKCLAWDVRDAARAESVMAHVVDKCGRIDAFVANAAIMPRTEWSAITVDEWRGVFSVNVEGAWHGVQAAAKPMAERGYGKIVVISSIEVLVGLPGHIHYTASKAALVGLTRSLARAAGPQGVRVNAIMPGAVQTQTELRQFPNQEEIAKYVDQVQCLPGRIQPQMVEPTAAFLCSSESDAITGQSISVDHGWSMH